MLMDLAQAAIDGLLFGSVYAVIGLGFTLIFGVMHRLNLAHAAASVAGAYVGSAAFQWFAAPPPVVFAVSALAAGCFGYAVYLACFRFAAGRDPRVALVTTIGMLLFIDALIDRATGDVPQPYPALFAEAWIEAGAFDFRGELLFVFVAGVVCVAMLAAILYRTRLGFAIRAVSQQPLAAELCGIRRERVNAATFFLAGAVGGVGAAMIGSTVGVLSPLLIMSITVKGLIVAVIGGLGYLPGAILAGLVVGATEGLALHLRGVTERDLYVMLLLFGFLAFRSGGLFAGRRAEHEVNYGMLSSTRTPFP